MADDRGRETEGLCRIELALTMGLSGQFAMDRAFARIESMRKLGIIGGLGPGATIHYYKELVKAKAGEMLIIHAENYHVLGSVQRGERLELAEYLARLIDRLARGGAAIAAISAVTPHFCIRELEKISALPLVDILDVIRNEIRSRGYKRVALFGTRFVVESRMFGMLDGIDVLVPDQVDAIHKRVHADRRGRNRRP
jgi:aspartate racemase